MDNFSLFREKLIKVMLIVTVSVSILCTSVVLVYASRKTIIVSEQETENVEEVVTVERMNTHWEIDTTPSSAEDDKLVLPIPSHISPELVELSVRYDLKTVDVIIDNTSEAFFLSNPPSGDFSNIESAEGYYDGDRTVISFKLKECAVVEASYYNKEIEMTFTPVGLVDKPVVVLDPGHGGAKQGAKVGEVSEKDVSLNICKAVERKAKDKPYLVLLTRNADVALNTEERIDTIYSVFGDYYIGVHLSLDIEDVKNFGLLASYYSGFYHNGLENVAFADTILKNVAWSTSNRANDLFDATEDEVILKVLDIPACILFAGFLSNPDEAKLLTDEKYIEKIADGIIASLDGVVK